MKDFDSRPETREHQHRVFELISGAVSILLDRAHNHDNSKFESPEVEVLDEMTPKLRGSTYGSDEYKGFLEVMKEMLKHHYRENAHHPEHFDRGIKEMGLIDLLEMLCDWKAASERHEDGDICHSLHEAQKRWNISPEMMQILWNTVGQLNWLRPQAMSTFKRAMHDYMQDVCEGCAFASVGGTRERDKMQAPDYIHPDDAEEYIAGYVQAFQNK